jgi:hypothetical protein
VHPLAAQIVDTKALLSVIVASLVAGVGGAAAFSMVIVGATRFGELRREGRTPAAGFFAAMAVVGGSLVAGAAVLGIVVMAHK